MATITFTGVVLRGCARTSKEATLTFSAEMTKGVAKALDWSDLPEKAIGSKMEGGLANGLLVMVPKQGELFSASEFHIAYQTLGHFEIVRRELEQSKGKGHRRELRFQVKSAAVDAAGHAESWLVNVKDGKASLKATFAVKSSGTEDGDSEDGDAND